MRYAIVVLSVVLVGVLAVVALGVTLAPRSAQAQSAVKQQAVLFFPPIKPIDFPPSHKTGSPTFPGEESPEVVNHLKAGFRVVSVTGDVGGTIILLEK